MKKSLMLLSLSTLLISTFSSTNLSLNTKFTAEHQNYDSDQEYIDQNKYQWTNDILNKVTRGFATDSELKTIRIIIKSFINDPKFKYTYLNKTFLAENPNKYETKVDLVKLFQDIKVKIESQFRNFEEVYQNALIAATSDLNLHGYSVDDLMEGINIPQTKQEIENFSNNMSWHDWLQAKADSDLRRRDLNFKSEIRSRIFWLIGSTALSCLLWHQWYSKFETYQQQLKFWNEL